MWNVSDIRCPFIFRAPEGGLATLVLMGRQPRLIADALVYHALNRGNPLLGVTDQLSLFEPRSPSAKETPMP